MAFADNRRAAAKFLMALAERRYALIEPLLRADVRLHHESRVYGRAEIAQWMDDFSRGRILFTYLSDIAADGAQGRGGAIASASPDADGIAAASCQVGFRLTWVERAISEIRVDPAVALPSVVMAYIRAMNGFDLDALLATFADDALVNDQLRDYWGKRQIAEWAARDIVGDRVTMAVVKVVVHYGHVIVTAHLDGTYDKRGLPDPLVMAFYFSSSENKIIQLIILRNMVNL